MLLNGFPYFLVPMLCVGIRISLYVVNKFLLHLVFLLSLFLFCTATKEKEVTKKKKTQAIQTFLCLFIAY